MYFTTRIGTRNAIADDREVSRVVMVDRLVCADRILLGFYIYIYFVTCAATPRHLRTWHAWFNGQVGLSEYTHMHPFHPQFPHHVIRLWDDYVFYYRYLSRVFRSHNSRSPEYGIFPVCRHPLLLFSRQISITFFSLAFILMDFVEVFCHAFIEQLYVQIYQFCIYIERRDHVFSSTLYLREFRSLIRYPFCPPTRFSKLQAEHNNTIFFNQINTYHMTCAVYNTHTLYVVGKWSKDLYTIF